MLLVGNFLVKWVYYRAAMNPAMKEAGT